MKLSLYTPIYAFTLLLSAALLFSVQPMFSKMILPLLGGTPQVWNTAMLFFQIMLLGGYAYAHGTSRFLSIKVQAILHIILLCLFIVVLPIAIPDGWVPPVDTDPTLWQLNLMAITVGGPFFVLAGSAPMLQRWFHDTDHPDADNPYFLYGASNLGSMTALLIYPVLIEPLLDLGGQSEGWALGYEILIAFTALSALLVWLGKAKQQKGRPKDHEIITWNRRGYWLLLAFIPSSLMLGVTTYITTDIASVPLIWIIPLALYVGTFILVFARKMLVPKDKILAIQGFLLIFAVIHKITFPEHFFVLLEVSLHIVLFFFTALMCHQELADSRPKAAKLTEFYLIMSLGGALGGFFNAIIAPQFFILPLEYALILGLACFMRFANQPLKLPERKFELYTVIFLINLSVIAFWLKSKIAIGAIGFILLCGLALLMERRLAFALVISVMILLYPPGHLWRIDYKQNTIHQDRSFFGVMRVIEKSNKERLLLHGTTNHGVQVNIEGYELEPMSYYGKDSPLREAFKFFDHKRGKQNIAIMGLGIGVTACFSKEQRHFDFFEIDPHVVEIAENQDLFTFLSDCGSPYEIILGDARLTIKDQPDQKYDLIVADAFSSDNIPIHLMTIEAIETYLSKLKPNGILVFHISNRYIDLEPVLAEASKHLGINALAKYTLGQKIEEIDIQTYPSHFVVFASTKTQQDFFEKLDWSSLEERKGVKLWSDKFSNIISVLRNTSGYKRHKDLSAEKEEEKERNQ